MSHHKDQDQGPGGEGVEVGFVSRSTVRKTDTFPSGIMSVSALLPCKVGGCHLVPWLW